MQQPTPPPAGWNLRGLLWQGGALAAAVILTLLAWWPSHDGWFVLDDYRWLMPPTRRLDILKWFVGTWGHGYAYRPLARLDLLFDLRVFGWHPSGWHLHNLLLHALNVWLLFALLWTVTARRGVALATAALFAVSPLSHENVGWISGRTFLLGGLFSLGSLNLLALAFIRPDPRRGPWWLAGGVLLFAAGLGSYEPTIVLPLLVVATMVCFPGLVPPGNPLVRRGLLWLFGLVPIYLLGHYVALKGHGTGGTTPTSYWLFAPLYYYWTEFITPVWDPRVVTPPLLAAAAVVTLVLGRVRQDLVPAGAWRTQAFLAIAAFILFLPFSNVTDVADRFYYLVQVAFIGTVVLLGYAVARLSRAGLAVSSVGLALLVAVGIAESRELAAGWAAAGRVNKAIADTIHARYPVWPAGTDLAIGGVASLLGGAPPYVLYYRESVLQHYLYSSTGFNPAGTDAQVYLTHLPFTMADAASQSARPVKYFQFDMMSFSLTEIGPAAWKKAHGTLLAR